MISRKKFLTIINEYNIEDDDILCISLRCEPDNVLIISCKKMKNDYPHYLNLKVYSFYESTSLISLDNKRYSIILGR